NPICIRISSQLKRRGIEIMKTIKQGTLNITKNCHIISYAKSRHELTNNVKNISNVRLGNSKINEITNKLTIKNTISEKRTIKGLKVSINLNRSTNNFGISKTCTWENVSSILTLSKKYLVESEETSSLKK